MARSRLAIAVSVSVLSFTAILLASHFIGRGTYLLQQEEPDQYDEWAATAATSPPQSSSSANLGPTGAQQSTEFRGRDGGVLSSKDPRSADLEPHTEAETFIDKHVYPPWPIDPDRAIDAPIEDKISEGELAARLSRAIDRHEKCRRHWPHLERLEAAQEIRVRDARNNLEVANRGIERARKELIDAENLVMGARQEHQVYEQKRSAFSAIRQEYLVGHSYVNSNRAAMKQNLERRNRELAILREKEGVVTALREEEKGLKHESVELKQETEKDSVELAQTESAGTALKFVKGQELAQLPREMKAPKKEIVVVRQRIAIPQALARLKIRAEQLSKQESKLFTALPSEEAQVTKFKAEIGNQRQELAAQVAKVAVGKKRIWDDRNRGESDKIVRLDRQKLQLSRVNEAIMQKELKEKLDALQKVQAKEEEAPALTEEISAIHTRMQRLDAYLKHLKALKSSGVQLSLKGETVPIGREMELAVVPRSMRAPRKAVYKTPSQLKRRMKSMHSKLRHIDSRLLGVRTRLAAQRQEVAVDEEKLQSRTHELTRSTRLAEQASADPKLAGITLLYQEKLRDVREERRKADGLLAKAERMLNIARIDTRNSARSKKAALEELTYATHKLRKYQDLRAKSQRCQMEAWSEIRHLTHNARERRMLEG